MSDTSESGIHVVEGDALDAPLPRLREIVTAFVGAASRGPVNIPVAVRSEAEFLRRFGVAGEACRMGAAVRQYFANGGRVAIIVRVGGGHVRRRLSLRGPAGTLLLEAANPGLHEHLRAAVDRHGLADDSQRFNLVLQQIESPRNPVVHAQEVHDGVSLDPLDERFIGSLLQHSDLARIVMPLPHEAPEATPLSHGAPVYVHCDASGEAGESVDAGDYDLVGCAGDHSGLHALEEIPVVDLVCLLPPRPGGSVGPVARLAAERYCRRRNALLLLDPPAEWSTVAIALRARRSECVTSPNVLMPFPVGNDGLTGALAGALAGRLQADALPAGDTALMLRGVDAPDIEPEPREQAALARNGLSVPLTHSAGRLRVPGAVTMGGPAVPEWRCALTRLRTLVMLGALGREMELARFAGRSRWRAVGPRIEAYLSGMQARGWLAGHEPAGGFWLEPLAEAGDRQLSGLVVGLAVHGPGRFSVWRFQCGLDGCSMDEISWQPHLARTG